MLPEEVDLRAREARDATSKLIGQNYQAAGGADVLMRVAEAAIAALRDTMRQRASTADARARRGPGFVPNYLIPSGCTDSAKQKVAP